MSRCRLGLLLEFLRVPFIVALVAQYSRSKNHTLSSVFGGDCRSASNVSQTRWAVVGRSMGRQMARELQESSTVP